MVTFNENMCCCALRQNHSTSFGVRSASFYQPQANQHVLYMCLNVKKVYCISWTEFLWSSTLFELDVKIKKNTKIHPCFSSPTSDQLNPKIRFVERYQKTKKNENFEK